MEPVATIERKELDIDPSARVWALVFYLADHPEEQTRSEFRLFWLAYIYDAQVLNGGHLQYFHNYGTEAVVPTLDALHTIGAHERAAILADCWSQVKLDPVDRVSSVEQYSELAMERSFDAEDSAYYAEKPELLELLERHYAPMLSEAVAVAA